MGYLSALGIADSNLSLEQQVRWHLTSNCYPPVPLIMVPVAVNAIDAVISDEPNAEIPLPEGVSFRGNSDFAPAYAIVETLRLEAFTITAFNPWEPDEDGNILCLDCMNSYDPDDIVTDPQWNDPRCEECHYKNK